MNCEEIANLISARIDGELSSSDEAALDAHLAGCIACRVMSAETELQDAAMLRAFSSRQQAALDLAERISQAIPQQSPAVRAVRRIGFAPIAFHAAGWAATAAAGFVAAIVLVKPANNPRASLPSATLQPAAHLILATGIVYTSASNQQTWRPIEAGAAIDRGAAVRTADAATCELRLPDGSCVRLDSGSEARFAGDRDVQVSAGQVWSAVPRNAAPICISAGRTSVTAGGMSNDGSEFELTCAGHAATVTVQRGTADVAGNGPRTLMHGGQTLGAPSQSAVFSCTAIADPTQVIGWQDELLARKPGDDPEVIARVSQLITRIASEQPTTNTACSAELDIRAHGKVWSTSIACILQNRATGSNPQTRRTAARLLSDLATSSNVPDLIGLLADEQGEVRRSAAAALHRLTGQPFGDSPDPSAAWRKWWEQNKSRYAAGE
jgi:ferric-dicitrate binding protein FerR (iron transport regulator)